MPTSKLTPAGDIGGGPCWAAAEVTAARRADSGHAQPHWRTRRGRPPKTAGPLLIRRRKNGGRLATRLRSALPRGRKNGGRRSTQKKGAIKRLCTQKPPPFFRPTLPSPPRAPIT